MPLRGQTTPFAPKLARRMYQDFRTAPLSTANRSRRVSPSLGRPPRRLTCPTALRPAFGSNQELTEFASSP